MLISRRTLVAAVSLAAAPFPARAQRFSRGVFTHGVASGDPLPDGVILWTRFAGAGDGVVGWEVSEDESFSRVAQRGEARASLSNDFCVKVDARGLAPGRRYFYRFLSASGPSLTDQTRTAPESGVVPLTIGLFSCANFAFGYFHAYGHAAERDDIDLILHAGDYIYEYRRGIYPSDEEAVLGRTLDPAGETVRVEDYYRRYAIYHTDPDLLELRRLKPMSAVWDDHEIANEAWRDGAQNHQDYEGTFADRIAAASKAYFDWMPIRRPTETGARLYRALDWGNLARIVLLDTRHIGRDQQLSYRSPLTRRLSEGGAAAARAAEEFRRTSLENANRTLLGATQEAWLRETFAGSKQRGHAWQIVLQQVVMGEQLAAPGLTRFLPESASSASRRYYGMGEQLGAIGLPWNLDSWGGYPAARSRFLQSCVHDAANVLILGGDSHNCWVNNLPADASGRLAALEFAGGSVTSPGFERPLSNAAPGEREALMRSGNPNLAFCDLTHRGYGALRFTSTACEAEWVAFPDVRSPQRSLATVARMQAEASATAGPGAWRV